MREIKIGDKWTYQDYGLWLSPDPEIGEPEPKVETIDIPYGDGSLDLTEALTGAVNYKERDISFGLVFPADVTRWDRIHKQLKNDVHGKCLDIIMPQYPDYLFNGRVRVGRLVTDKSIATADVTITADPFMLKNTMTVVTATVPSSGTLTLNLKNERMTTLPEFTISATSQIVSGTDSYSHSAGTFTLANIYLVQGNNQITIKAVAGTTVSISYQEGAL